MTAPTIATDKGYQRVPGCDRPVNVYALTKGHAFRLCEDGWALVAYHGPNKEPVEYTFKILWIQGRACALFDWGGVQYAQPINGNLAPSQERAERRKAREERAEVKAPPGVKTPLPLTVESAPPPPPATVEGPSKAALKLAKMRARMAAAK